MFEFEIVTDSRVWDDDLKKMHNVTVTGKAVGNIEDHLKNVIICEDKTGYPMKFIKIGDAVVPLYLVNHITIKKVKE